MKEWKSPLIKDTNMNILYIIGFASTEVTELEEVYTYPILSFLSELGGALGLFLGFSFLMIWDFSSWTILTLKRKLQTKK